MIEVMLERHGWRFGCQRQRVPVERTRAAMGGESHAPCAIAASSGSIAFADATAQTLCATGKTKRHPDPSHPAVDREARAKACCDPPPAPPAVARQAHHP